ncbi:hypothetical protein Kpho01_58600 [Kitasatospora phosalacinea]|uniref:Uncharacterized protein n=1 Tax=Kitasatospora phosalacinea TaxID=2065 RepID=A0A9W6PK98_9ACTN|nr:hypothetical protein Kpho01_58600 [Kitasatospora phosalacinea]
MSVLGGNAPCLPQPEFSYPLGHAKAGCVRWSCPEWCRWHHDKWPGLEPGRIELPARPGVAEGQALGEVRAAYSPEEISQSLTATANRREEVRRERVLNALEEHLRTVHNDHASGADSLSPQPTSPRRRGTATSGVRGEPAPLQCAEPAPVPAGGPGPPPDRAGD